MSLSWAQHPVLLVVNILAAFRLTWLLVEDKLPPLPTIRAAIVRRAEARWEPTEQQARDYDDTPPLAQLISCPWCLGFWVSCGVTLLASTGSWWLIVAVPLALSAAVGLLASH